MRFISGRHCRDTRELIINEAGSQGLLNNLFLVLVAIFQFFLLPLWPSKRFRDAGKSINLAWLVEFLIEVTSSTQIFARLSAGLNRLNNDVILISASFKRRNWAA
jgi:hypothetical protein